MGEEEIQKKILSLPRGPGRPKKSVTSVMDEDVSDEEMDDSLPKVNSKTYNKSLSKKINFND